VWTLLFADFVDDCSLFDVLLFADFEENAFADFEENAFPDLAFIALASSMGAASAEHRCAVKIDAGRRRTSAWLKSVMA